MLCNNCDKAGVSDMKSYIFEISYSLLRYVNIDLIAQPFEDYEEGEGGEEGRVGLLVNPN